MGRTNVELADLARIEAVIHDWNDTAAPTFEVAVGLHVSFAEKNGLAVPTSEKVKSHWGKPLEKMLAGIFQGHDSGWLLQRFNESVGDDFEIPPFSWLPDILDQLQAAGLVLAVVSSMPSWDKDKVRRNHPRVNLERYVYFQTGDDSQFHKPDERAFEPAINELKLRGVNREHVLYVGDHLNDFVGAMNAGLLFVAVLTGFTPRYEFLRAFRKSQYSFSDELILDDFSQLPQLLQRARVISG